MHRFHIYNRKRRIIFTVTAVNEGGALARAAQYRRGRLFAVNAQDWARMQAHA